MPKPAVATAGLRLGKSTVATEAAPIIRFVSMGCFVSTANGQ